MPNVVHPLQTFYDTAIAPRLTPETIWPGIDFTAESSGSVYRGSTCPICNDTSPRGAFHVLAKYNWAYKCYACNSSGSVFAGLNGGVKPTGQRYIELLTRLANVTGQTLPGNGFSDGHDIQPFLDRKALLAKFYDLAREAMSHETIGKPGRDYVRHVRNITDKATIDAYELGYWPNADWFRSRLSQAELRVAKTEKLFTSKLCATDWIVFPWRDMSGEPLTAYFRRTTPVPAAEPGQPKQPKTYALPGEQSKSVPYGLCQARRGGSRSSDFVVVEGPMDVLACSQAGLSNVISYIAARPSGGQLATFSRLPGASYTLLGDNDIEGLKGITDSGRKLVCDGAKVYVADIASVFGPGQDPAEYLSGADASGIESLVTAISRARNYASYIGLVYGRLYAAADTDKLRDAAIAGLLAESSHMPRDVWLSQCLPEFQVVAQLAKEALAALGIESLTTRIEAMSSDTGTDTDDIADVVVATDEKRVNDQALQGLVRQGKVYQRDGELVEVKADTRRQGYYVSNVAKARLRELLSDGVRFVKVSAKSERSLAHPPVWTVEALHCRRYWSGLNVLNGIVETPVLRKDGTVFATPGYDKPTGLWYGPPKNVTFEPVPDAPTLLDAQRCRDELLDLVSDVPFESEVDKAAWLCALLTPFARPAFDGPMPLNHVDANTPGSGKTLLLKVINAILTSDHMPTMSVSHDDAENEKRITAFLRLGAQIQVFDNVSGRFGGKSFDMLLTSDKWQGRLLGASDLWTGPNRTVVYSTGNNIQLLGDMHRRMLRIKLKTDMERPESRSGFRYPKLEQHVRSNRGRYVTAALTILRGFFAAGCPEHNGVAMGSFEDWSRVVRGAVVWCGMADPAANISQLSNELGSEGNLLGSFVAGWLRTFGYDGVTGGEIRRFLIRDDDGDDKEDFRDTLRELCNLTERETPKARVLVNKLSPFRNRVSEGHRLIVAINSRRGKTDEWRLEKVEEKQEEQESANCRHAFDSRQSDGSASPMDSTHCRQPPMPLDSIEIYLAAKGASRGVESAVQNANVVEVPKAGGWRQKAEKRRLSAGVSTNEQVPPTCRQRAANNADDKAGGKKAADIPLWSEEAPEDRWI